MMKILFLNHHLHEAPVLTTLRNLGVAAIVCSDLRECELVFRLHASSVSLFVGHDDDGVKMNEILKTNPRFARTPVILTTSKWSDQQCIDHQATPMGANAYLRMPVEDKDFIRVVDEILATALSHGQGYNVSDELSALVPVAGHSPVDTLEFADDKTKMGDLGLALADAGLPVMGSDAEGTKLSILGSTEPVGTGEELSVAGTPVTSQSIGEISLQTEGNAGASPVAHIQLEDAAAVYGDSVSVIENSDGTPDLAMAFNLDAPPTEGLPNAMPADYDPNTNGTKEFRIETGDGATQIAAEIVATPIEATPVGSLGSSTAVTMVAAPMTSPLGDEILAIGGTSEIPSDEQPTRVAVSAPISTSTTSSAISSTNSEELDADSLSAMPYLGKEGFSNPLAYREPMDDAVVPGGAASAPDVDTLKKYLYLREQDVTALSAQLRQAREQIGNLENQLRQEKAVTSEFAHLAQEQDRRINTFDKEKFVAVESAQKEIDELKFEMKRRSEKIRVMELQVKEATEATERLKERVRNDIRKIRAREKELENRLEIMKKDSEALLGSREQKIIELKRKLDLMEFNTDLLQEQLERERGNGQSLREKLAKAAQIMRVAGGILSPEEEAMIASGEVVNERTTAA